MPAQLRIYTINRGMMDSWLEVFNQPFGRCTTGWAFRW